jgi:hypothetical protein
MEKPLPENITVALPVKNILNLTELVYVHITPTTDTYP